MLPGVSEKNRDSDNSEALHDYAEIYTPSREGVNWTGQSSETSAAPRPPTPPLHRFPSWEAKIYQVADGGLGIGPPTNDDASVAPSSTSNTNSSKHSHGHNLTAHNSQGYCDISVPVYATVKGNEFI